ncbi:sulfotransferase domain-containing protein [Psychroserpens burtonensis]|uniref:Sulfotransferase domain-containing protein n=1 Tax=Psychroserpens burtonensis TaxID=49278 RepID=A0A5C7B6T8_9FLAO|nr:sulfotransferase domain-containing protein [Psychroserpens burtonensis]TXE17133.1 sulfotransferase domain-containing protein [Psychroserpens burtonensis]
MNKFKKNIKRILKFDLRIAQQTENRMRTNNFLPISETKPQDIFIAGFPKSGNTWMQNLIAGLQYGIETSMLPDTLTQELIPDVHGKQYYKRFHDVMFFKTHELPKKEMRRVIHLVRDGRDVMASYFAMNQAMKKQITLEDMIVHGIGVYPSKWHEHTRMWLDNPFKADVLIIKYEDLIQNAFEELQKVIAFAQLDCSDDMINRCIEGNSFKAMKKKEKVFGWNNLKWDKNENFIRKGEIGTYKKEVPKELIKVFEEVSKDELKFFNFL